MVVTNDLKGRYFRNFSAPSASITRARGNAESPADKMFITDESASRKWPAGVVRLKISAKSRGLGLLIESQQGVRKATGRLPGICVMRSRQPLNVSTAA